MRAYKCDICGKLFANNDNTKATGSVICNRRFYSGSGKYEEYLADVCPECNNAFHKLMKELQEEVVDERSDS